MFIAKSLSDLPDRQTVISMSGLDFMQAVQSGELAGAPIAQGLNFTLHSVEKGAVTFRGSPGFAHTNPVGGVHGGWYGTLLDSCMGLAIQSTLDQGVGSTTLEFKISLVRAITLETGQIRAEGKVLNCGRRVGTAEGRVTDAKGRLLAHGTTTCLIFPG